MELLNAICKELGVEVGEEWEANDGSKYKFNKLGVLLEQTKTTGEWYANPYRVNAIIKGDIKPIWKPEDGERYYAPNIIYENKHIVAIWGDRNLDYWRLENRLVFKTKEEAEEKAKKMLEVVK